MTSNSSISPTVYKLVKRDLSHLYTSSRLRQPRSQDFARGGQGAVAFWGGSTQKTEKLGLQMVLELRFGAGVETSGAGAGAPVELVLATSMS